MAGNGADPAVITDIRQHLTDLNRRLVDLSGHCTALTHRVGRLEEMVEQLVAMGPDR